MRMGRKLAKDQRGATAVEYALIMALIFLAMVTAVIAFGQQTILMWTNIAQDIEDARN
jgi:pilus assembly protein Flp/PilA